MNESLSATGYQQTHAKLESLKRRLGEIVLRQDMDPAHKVAVINSYKSMARQYRREIKLYEARHAAASR